MSVLRVLDSAATNRASIPGRWLNFLSAACIVLSLSACSAGGKTPRPGSTMLLVSLEDGSIIRQEIVANADVCMKSIDSPETTCLQQGAPIYNGEQLIGYQMHRSDIQLIPK